MSQAIQYFDPQANRAHQGQILELHRKQVVVLDVGTQKRWLISYAAINLDGADVEIRERPKQGLGRNEVTIGDVVGFVDRKYQQRSARTVRLICGNQQWRSAYELLHRVVESSCSRRSNLIAFFAQAEGWVVCFRFLPLNMWYDNRKF